MFGFNAEKALANAEKYVQQGKFAQAIELYEKVLDQQPTNLHLRNNLGDLYARAGRNDEAVKMFKEVADHFDEQGMSQRAIAILKKIIKIEPDNKEILQRLAHLLVGQGGQAEAKVLLIGLVDRAERAGDWNTAGNGLAQVIAIDTEQPRLRLRLARLRLKQGDKKRAQAELLAAGDFLLGLKDFDGAALAIKEVAAIDPSSPRYRLLVAKWELAHGNPEKALAALPPATQITELEADAATVWRIALESGDAQQAIVLGAAAVRAGHTGVIAELGSTLIEVHNIEAAVSWPRYDAELMKREDLRPAWIEHLRKVVAVDAESIPALETWAVLAGDNKDAAREPLTHLAQLHTSANRLEKAIACYERLSALLPSDAGIAQQLEQLREKAGDHFAEVDAVRTQGSKQSVGEIESESETEQPEIRPVEFTKPSSRSEQRAAEFEIMPASQFDDATSSEPVVSAANAEAESNETSSDDGAIEFDLANEWTGTRVDDIDEQIVEIENLLNNSDTEAAEQQLRRILQQYPKDKRLLAIKDRVAAAQAEEEGSTSFIVTPVVDHDDVDVIGGDDTQELEVSDDWTDTTDDAVAAEVEESDDASSEALASTSEPDTEDSEADFITVEDNDISDDGSPAEPPPPTRGHKKPAAASKSAQRGHSTQHAGSRNTREQAGDFGRKPSPPVPNRIDDRPAASARSGGLLDDVFSDLRADLAAEIGNGSQPLELPPPRRKPAASNAPIASNHSPGSHAPGEKPKPGGLLDDVFHEFRASVETGKSEGSSDPEARYNMGVAYREMGLHEDAIAELQKAFAAWKKISGSGHKLLSCGATIALCFQDAGMPELAIEWYETTLRSTGLSAIELIGVRFELAQLLESLGRTEEALKLYRQVYATDVDYQDVAECLRRLQSNLGAPAR